MHKYKFLKSHSKVLWKVGLRVLVSKGETKVISIYSVNRKGVHISLYFRLKEVRSRHYIWNCKYTHHNCTKSNLTRSPFLTLYFLHVTKKKSICCYYTELSLVEYTWKSYYNYFHLYFWFVSVYLLDNFLGINYRSSSLQSDYLL